MPTVSVNIPEKMKEKITELSEEEMYQNESEYIRDALRQKIQSASGLTPEEEEEVLRRIKQVEDSKEVLLTEREFIDELKQSGIESSQEGS